MQSTIGNRMIAIFGAMLIGGTLLAQDIQLPEPAAKGGKPLMEVLKERRSLRAYSNKALPPQMMSDLLWAAWGINRADGRHTAPTACNNQEIDLYVCLPSGVYLYDPKANTLKQAIKDDVRKKCGIQPFVGTAPLTLVIAVDRNRMNRLDDSGKTFYAGIDAGYVSQNIYLYCASTGLSTVAIGYVDRPALSKALKLKSHQEIIITQPVGFAR